MRPAEQRRNLFPYSSLKERNTNGAMTKIMMRREAVYLLRRDDLILILLIDLAKRAEKASCIASQPDIEIFQVPGGDEDVHELGAIGEIRPRACMSNSLHGRSIQRGWSAAVFSSLRPMTIYRCTPDQIASIVQKECYSDPGRPTGSSVLVSC